ncbi:MAG: LLM class F420-dependent oxidoreductase [Dehalococcoidia bacterium]
MKFGISLQSRGPAASPDNLALVAQRADELGFDSAFLGDHIVIPDSFVSEYPYSATGAFTAAGSGECLEQLTVLTFVAAKTQRIRLAPSVMILPHRNPLVAAKILATIDVLSKGRLILGVGVGWLREEFEALGLPPFEERGAVSDEYIRVFKELWTKDNPSFQGKYCSFSNIRFEPKPVQKPHPPIWIGGESPPALRRAAALGDAWHPIGSNPRYPLVTADQLKESVGRLAQYAERAGRNPSEIEVAYRVPQYRLTDEGHTQPFVGSADQIADDIRAFAAVGAKHLVFDFRSDDVKKSVELIEQFASQIMPKVEDLS